MEICKLYVVRHGQSVHNRDNLTSGHGDAQLTEKGRRQAEVTKETLSAIQFDEVYSSDLQRAADTAEIIFGAPVPDDHRFASLRERNYGAMEGTPITHWEDIKCANQAKLAAMSTEELWQFKHAPDAESDFEVSERFIETLVEIAGANLGKTVLVAAHGGTLRTMLIKLGYATSAELPSKSIDNAAYVELDYNNGSFTVGAVGGVNIQP